MKKLSQNKFYGGGYVYSAPKLRHIALSTANLFCTSKEEFGEITDINGGVSDGLDD